MLIEWLRILQGHPAHKFFPELGQAPEPSPFRRVYMFGDKPGSDIYGANACAWESLLLRTGVFRDSSGPPLNTSRA